MKTYVSLGSEEAMTIAESILNFAEKRGIPIAVTVLDARGICLVSLMQDGALPITPKLSEAKANMAFKMDMPTLELQKEGVNIADFRNGYSSFGGGVPVKDAQGRSWGFIGVSGAKTGELDHEIAMEWTKVRIEIF